MKHIHSLSSTYLYRENIIAFCESSHLFLITLCLLCVLTIYANASAQAGGEYGIERSVIANSGGEVSGGMFSLTGTAGQPVAGVASIGSGFAFQRGFWTRDLAPTASMSSIRGRIITADGHGIRSVVVRLRKTDGTFRTTLTASLGYYFFEEIEAGQAYVLTVTSKRFTFAEPSRIVNVGDAMVDVDFVAMP